MEKVFDIESQDIKNRLYLELTQVLKKKKSPS